MAAKFRRPSRRRRASPANELELIPSRSVWLETIVACRTSFLPCNHVSYAACAGSGARRNSLDRCHSWAGGQFFVARKEAPRKPGKAGVYFPVAERLPSAKKVL